MLGLIRAPDRTGRGRRRPDVSRPRPRIVAWTRTPGLVVIVSDFRGPRDWLPALANVAGRHAVIALEIADPREDQLVDVGELTLIDPETGRMLRVDTSDRASDRVRVRRRRTRVARGQVPPAGRPPPPPLDRRPVAPDAHPFAGTLPNRTTP